MAVGQAARRGRGAATHCQFANETSICGTFAVGVSDRVCRSEQSPLTKPLNRDYRVAIRFFLEESGLDSRERLYADLNFARLKMLFCVGKAGKLQAHPFT